MSTPEPEVFLVEGHQIRGYELLKRKVSRANKSAGRVVVPVDWAWKAVKVIIGGEVYEDLPRAAAEQARLNIKAEHIDKIAWVVRVEP